MMMIEVMGEKEEKGRIKLEETTQRLLKIYWEGGDVGWEQIMKGGRDGEQIDDEGWCGEWRWEVDKRSSP